MKINAETIEDMETLIDSALTRIINKIDHLNANVGEKKNLESNENVILDPMEMKLFRKLKKKFAIHGGGSNYVLEDSESRRYFKYKPTRREIEDIIPKIDL